jgi:hypothetical protein
MEERQIIATLKELREVKPSDDWKEATRAYIVGFEHSREKVFSGGFSMPFGQLFNQAKFVPALIPILIVVLAGAGIFAHFYLGSPEGTPGDTGVAGIQESSATYLVLAETKLEQIEGPEDIKEVTEILAKAADTISSEPSDPAERAKIVASVANINKKVQELDLDEEGMKGIENLKDKASTLTAVTAHVLEENIKSITEELVESLIEMLETRTLSEEQEELFKEAKSDYNNQEFGKALEKILLLSDNNETN